MMTFVRLFILCLIANHNISATNSNSVLNMQTVAEEILNDLKRAKGILPTEKPFLIIPNEPFTGSQKLAVMNMVEGTITLDSRSYLHCRSLGKDSLNGLAFILGHELGHFIKGHGNINHNISSAQNFMSSSASLNLRSGTSNEFQQKLNQALDEYGKTYNEAEADFEGAFLGFLAGYDPVASGRAFLKSVYADPKINLNPSSSGYPTLQERLDILQNTENDLKKYIPYFDMANYLVAIEQYEDAVPYLEKILVKFQSPELYNNIGVILLLETLRLFPEPLTKYNMPLSLDAHFRAPHPQHFNTVDDPGPQAMLMVTELEYLKLTLAQKQIEQAESYFQKAFQLDQDYALAHLNMAIALSYKAQMYPRGRLRIITLHHALGEARKSIDLYTKALNGFQVYSYAVSEDQRDQVIFNPDIKDNPDFNFLIRDIIFENEDLVPNTVEFIGQKKWDITKDNPKPINYKRWNTPDFNPPNEAYGLANAMIQFDIIKILNKEFDFEKGIEVKYDGVTLRHREAFKEVLDFIPDYKLAVENQLLSKNITVTNDENQIGVNPKLETFSGLTLEQIIPRISEWDINEQLQKSKIISHYVSGDMIANEDLDRLIQSEIPMSQQVQYREMTNFFFYNNTSKISLDGRTERSTILVPKFSGETTTISGIVLGMEESNLKEKYGTAIREVQLTDGKMNVYLLESNGSMSHHDTGELIPEKNIKEDGIIFKLDNNNKITSWAIYQKDIKTKAI